ncbi:hypothetical protein [Aliagarivorans taiwanensis]|uniref:hypothetical protein n=1 Tax=Aliagarivorans taiwanensis TaxID=561966 RepID=UPI00041FB342|nr:hypothetical protein [Aliagarivorans taiwanensis]
MRRVALLLVLILAWVPKVLADNVLIIQGNIREVSGMAFSLEDIKAMEQHSFVTKHPWTEVGRRYQGPLLADVLDVAQAKGKMLRMVALNDYEVEVDFSDIKKFQPILAWQQDGKTLSIREKGPLWLMFPVDDYPEVKNKRYNDYMIWQLRVIEVK